MRYKNGLCGSLMFVQCGCVTCCGVCLSLCCAEVFVDFDVQLLDSLQVTYCLVRLDADRCQVYPKIVYI